MIDGDTLATSAGTVRIIGIDSPERGECGSGEAAGALSAALAPGETLTLALPAGQNAQDRHGRLLRSVAGGGIADLGLAQLEAGHAVARYDSRDGYPRHPLEDAYHSAQIASLDAEGRVLTPACAAAAEAAAAAVPTAPPAEPPTAPGTSGDDWWRQYPSCAALKRNTVGHPVGPFNRDAPDEAAAYQWFQFGTGHRGDGDGDGLACE
ncbi:thermonuclease family protein [Leucobacter luti]|uniref:thermonuclease family protein n=1 Tax=Leucobacter luti TaxID=340320 RepID=UPI003CFDAEB6